jgi:hypothetical protein
MCVDYFIVLRKEHRETTQIIEREGIELCSLLLASLFFLVSMSKKKYSLLC